MPSLCGRGLPPRFAFWKSGFSSGAAAPLSCWCSPRGSCDRLRVGDALAAHFGLSPEAPNARSPAAAPSSWPRARARGLARPWRLVPRVLSNAPERLSKRLPLLASCAVRRSFSFAGPSSRTLSPASSPVPVILRRLSRAPRARALYTRFSSENELQNGDFSPNFRAFGLKACPISCFVSCTSIFPSRRQCAKCAFQIFAFGSVAMNSSPS